MRYLVHYLQHKLLSNNKNKIYNYKPILSNKNRSKFYNNIKQKNITKTESENKLNK